MERNDAGSAISAVAADSWREVRANITPYDPCRGKYGAASPSHCNGGHTGTSPGAELSESRPSAVHLVPLDC